MVRHPKGRPHRLSWVHMWGGMSKGLCWEPLWILRSPLGYIWGFGAYTRGGFYGGLWGLYLGTNCGTWSFTWGVWKGL